MGCCGFPGGGGGGGAAQWLAPITITHTQFQAAALTNNIVVYSLPAAGFIHGVKLKHSVIWDGPAITEYWLSVGFTVNVAALLIEYDVESTPVGDTEFAISGTWDSRNHAAATDVRVAARSVGANLNTSTQGTAQLWLMVSFAP